MRYLVWCALLVTVVAGAFGCGGTSQADTTAEESEEPTLLFVLDVPKATARPTSAGYELRLIGVDPLITWFSDRPFRVAGTMPARELLSRWGEFGFTTDPPNATLTIHPTGAKARAVPVTLTEPTDDLADGILTLQLKNLPLANGEASEPLPLDLGPTSVFLDSVSGSNTNLSQQNAVANQQAMNDLGICLVGPPC